MLNKSEKVELKKIIEKENRFFISIFLFIFFITLFFFFIIKYFNTTKLNIVAESQGTVVPSSKVKTVQHLEGGIIKNISVRVGDIVKKNQVLLELEPTKSFSNFSELEKRLVSLEVNITRLRAEAENTKLIFKSDTLKDYPRLVTDAKKLYQARKNSFNASLREFQRTLENERKTLGLLEEQIQISKSLLEEQLTNRLNHLDLLKEKSSSVSRIEQAKSKISTMRELRATEIRTLLLEKISEFEELSERKIQFKDSLNRTTVKAPEEGIIKQRFVDTIGGVIRAGDPLFDIVPINDKLIILSKLSVDQIGYIKKGQKVLVKLTGKNNAIYQPIEGNVKTISPDAIYTENIAQEPFYEVKIETDRNYFVNDNEKYYMYPGTPVLALIEIGTRTISNYLLEPIISSLNVALSEK